MGWRPTTVREGAPSTRPRPTALDDAARAAAAALTPAETPKASPHDAGDAFGSIRGSIIDLAGRSPQRALTALASADFLLAAWFEWMTPLETALSSFFDAVIRAADTASLSCPATASRTRRTCVLSSDFTALLRRRAFSLVPMRLIWDLMFATCGLSCAFAEAI